MRYWCSALPTELSSQVGAGHWVDLDIIYLQIWDEDNQVKCVVPENIHTSPMEGDWIFQGGGGGVNLPNFPVGRGGGRVTKGIYFQSGYRILKSTTETQ